MNANQRQSFSKKPPKSVQCPISDTSPLTQILGEPGDPACFTKAQSDRLRMHVAMSAPLMPCRELEQFIGELFMAPEVLSAYFRPRVIHAAVGASGACYSLPFDLAMTAGRRAASMGSLQAHERGLAWVSAFTYPCGMFAAAELWTGPTADIPQLKDLSEASLLRSALIRDPIRRLCRRNQPLGDTLSAVMGLDLEAEYDKEQLARILTSVRLAVIRVEQVWSRRP